MIGKEAECYGLEDKQAYEKNVKYEKIFLYMITNSFSTVIESQSLK